MVKKVKLLPRTRFQLANALAAIGHASAARGFRAALEDPDAAQHRILCRILSRNAQSAFGRHHGFARITDATSYRETVPIADHAAFAPWMERTLNGEPGVLTTEPVLMFEKTSGSTQAAKYIPYTASLRSEFQEAAAAWLFDLWRSVPGLRHGGAYWSVSPAARVREQTPGGHPVGFADDTEYFDPLTRWVLNQLLIVPGTVARIPDMESCRYVTLRYLLAGADLALVSVWNPSFLTLLLKAAATWRDSLIRDVRDGTVTLPSGGAIPGRIRFEPERNRAAALERALERPWEDFDATAIWPRLALISCWADSSAAMFLPELGRRFPGVPVQGKGLLSTEGVVSIPLVGHPGAALAVTSHFLEFLPSGDQAATARPALASELEQGGRYAVLLTTGGGLYRYATHDVVEVVGRVGRTPLVRFVGKLDHVSDVCGEKLSAMHVEQVLADVVPEGASFAMLAPEAGPDPHYVLFLEGSDDATSRGGPERDLPEAAKLDVRLRENPHYAYCRDLGQLGPPRVVPVVDGQRKYLIGCEALGQKPGNIKPVALHRALGWAGRFA